MNCARTYARTYARICARTYARICAMNCAKICAVICAVKSGLRRRSRHDLAANPPAGRPGVPERPAVSAATSPGRLPAGFLLGTALWHSAPIMLL